MSVDYHWPHPEAVRSLNQLLALPATGQEQDWEIELADPDRLPEMLDLFRDGSLDLEGRSALALLILFALEQSQDPTLSILVADVRAALRWDPEILSRAISYWDRLERSSVVDAVLR